MPFALWLKGPLREVMHETLSETRVKRRGLLNAEAVSLVEDQFLGGTIDWNQPWLLMMIELWASEILDKSSAGLLRETDQHCLT